MTDVRLTALNPIDSQVYPVACNTSGELIVEQVDPGPDLTVTGNLTVNGTSTFDGNAAFDGITAAGDIQSTDGTNISSIKNGGTLFVNQATANNSASTPALEVVGAGVTTANIFSDGSAQFSESNVLFSTAGIATFKSQVRCQDSTGGAQLAIGTLNSAIYATDTIFLQPGGTTSVTLSSNGNTSFTGDITCSSNTKGLVLKSPNGTSYRLSVANDGTLSTSAV